MARHPLARAVRADKLDPGRAGGDRSPGRPLAGQPGAARRPRPAARPGARGSPNPSGATVVPHDGRVGGGGAPGVPLPGWAVRLAESAAARLRTGRPAVLPRVHDGACLVDLRCIPEADDDRLLDAIRAALVDGSAGS